MAPPSVDPLECPLVLDYREHAMVRNDAGYSLYGSSPRKVERSDWNDTAYRLPDDFTDSQRARTMADLSLKLVSGVPRAPECVYCSQPLAVENGGSPLTWETRLAHCECGWWTLSKARFSGWSAGDGCSRDGGGYGQERTFYEGILRTFRVSDLAIPLDTLRRHLRHSGTDVRYTAPSVLERLVADVFADTFSGCEVRHVGGPGDHGVDVYVLLTELEPYLIQVKRRGPSRTTEGVTTVREFCGVMAIRGVSRGAIVSTATRFSKAAVDEASLASSARHRIDMDLIDLRTLVGMLSLERHGEGRYEPWSSLL
jgi:hypothetical protein